MNRKSILLVLALCLTLLPLRADIVLDPASPQVGEEVKLSFDVAVDTLVVSYRPNSAVVRRDTLVNAAADSQMSFKPDQAGVLALSYKDKDGKQVSQNVSVRFDGLSYSGLLVMILAGCLLFGGAILAFRTLFRDEEEDGTIDFDPEEVPDT